jgi:hypothetical protein
VSHQARPSFRTKPILKSNLENSHSSQDGSIEVKDKDFFQTYTDKVRTKREVHVKKTLEWANQGGFFKTASILDGPNYSGSQPGES